MRNRPGGMRSGLASFAASAAVTAVFAVDWLPHRWDGLIVLAIGVALGLSARGFRRLGHIGCARGLAIGTLAGAALIAFGDLWTPHDKADALLLLALQAPAIPVFVAMAMPRYAASFAFGALVGLGPVGGVHVFSTPFALPLGFLIARRAGTGTVLPSSHARWSMVGIGALSMILVGGLATDAWILAREVAGPLGGPLAQPSMFGSLMDDRTSFVPRVLVEVVLLRACVGASRGHASGIVVLTVLAPVLAIVSYSDLPMWQGGCFSGSHPFHDVVPALLALALAVGPWVWRFARQQLAESQADPPEACAR